MELSVNVVKRQGKRDTEQFSIDKLRSSIIATCQSLRTPIGQSELTANIVCNIVIRWLKNRSEVTSNDLRIATAKTLNRYHPEAAYLYEQYHFTI